MRKIVLTFGLIAGAILAGMMLLTQRYMSDIGFDRAEVIGYTTMVLAFLMVFFGVRSYRDTVAGGTVSFWRAFKVGCLITAVASACYVATWEFVFYRMAPDFVDKYTAAMVEKARKSGATEEKIAAEVKRTQRMMAWYRIPVFNVAMTFLEPLPVGLVLTLVSAGVLSRKRDAADATLA